MRGRAFHKLQGKALGTMLYIKYYPLRGFYFVLYFSFLYFVCVFNKAIILLVLVDYDMIIASHIQRVVVE